MDNDKKTGIRVDTENLAVPEVHVNETDKISKEMPHDKDSIMYDNLAVPEIVFRHKNKEE